MEKRSQTYDLSSIKTAFQTVQTLRVTRSARQCIVALGLSLENVVEIIQTLTSQDFYKSMTTYVNSRVWQDVYHAHFHGIQLYIKFMIDEEGYLVVSFKAR